MTLQTDQIHRGVVRVSTAPKSQPAAAPSYEPNMVAAVPGVAGATAHPISTGPAPEVIASANVSQAEEKAAPAAPVAEVTQAAESETKATGE